MFRPAMPKPADRRGTILITTLALLTLFASIALVMVIYAQGAAERARITKDAMSAAANELPDDGNETAKKFLSQFIFDSPDFGTSNGLSSSIRGHSLMATMYGRQPGNIIPWNGFGTFSQDLTALFGGVPLNRRQFVNYRVFQPGQTVLDPEYVDPRTNFNLGNTSTYIPKNAPYTYPDVNNLFLASLIPATGEVPVISYYRSHLFRDASQPLAATGLEPTNPNWLATRPQGKFLILRPRPEDHAKDPVTGLPLFPYPPQNADGTYTGDVQNLPGGVGPQKNDSIWIDIGMGIITLGNGKRYKPLVAPLILDLDGRLNLNAHGNRLLSNTTHTSGAGIGPWEVSLERALAANQVEAQQIVSGRGTALTQSGQNQKPYLRYPGSVLTSVYGPLPGYSAVAWNGGGGANINSLNLPGYGTTGSTALCGCSPLYTATVYDSTNPTKLNHPALYNPTEWPTNPFATPTTPTRSFPLTDSKLLSIRYAAAPSNYTALDVGNPAIAPNSIRGNNPPNNPQFPLPYPVQANTQSTYRLDPAHANRMLFTSQSYSLDRTSLVDPSSPTNPLAALAASLGPIDLNRTLTDYRDPNKLGQGLDPSNIANAANADQDRQRFAMDIFIRLVAAAGLVSDGTMGIDQTTNKWTITNGSVTPSTPIFNTLRSYAQLAANIVDYIDSDDISTRFVWNPINLAEPQPQADQNNFTAAEVGNRVVFGVEKPRLLLNEAYAETTNDPTDTKVTTAGQQPDLSKKAHVRFWLEFQNPTRPNPTAPGSTIVSPLGTDGKVAVRYAGISPYRVEIVRNSPGGAGNVSASLRDPNQSAGNVTGAIVGPPPDLIFDFSPATPGTNDTVAPATGNPGAGILVCAANVGSTVMADEFDPQYQTGPNVINAAAPGTPGFGSLTYLRDLTQALDNDRKTHVVLLRRLANPYLPGPDVNPTNPYITVDFIDNVPAFDAIKKKANSTQSRIAKPANDGYDPALDTQADIATLIHRYSLGKVQPFASFTNPTPLGDYPTFTFPKSLVLNQRPVDGGGNPVAGVRQTFRFANSKMPSSPPTSATYSAGTLTNNETLMTPYEWLVHMDRPLLNSLEVLHVSVGKPYEQTLQSITPNNLTTPTDVVKHTNTFTYKMINDPVYQPLYRALDLLRIQPYGQQTAHAGRIPGRININTITDKRVWDALFDAQTGINAFTQNDVDALWNTLIKSRSPSTSAGTWPITRTRPDGQATFLTTVPGPTVYDMNTDNPAAPFDRPFTSFGVPNVQLGTGTSPAAGVTLYGGGLGRNDTLLRAISGVNNGTDPVMSLPINAANGIVHPYQQIEAARKIMNNVTTVSHTFAVWITVGYFEVVNETASSNTALPNIVQLGKEYYKDVPGDFRYKFFSLVDRSMVGLDPLSSTTPTPVAFGASGPTAVPGSRPFFTTLEAFNATDPTTRIGSTTFNFTAAAQDPVTKTVYVYSDGVAVPVNGGNLYLVIGEGANRELVSVTTPLSYSNGIATATVSGLTKNHSPGEVVSNIVPGNPGPQPSFDPKTDMYKAIVPHFSRIP